MNGKSDDLEAGAKSASEGQLSRGSKSCTPKGGSILAAGGKSVQRELQRIPRKTGEGRLRNGV
jgi:hypothetical protein